MQQRSVHFVFHATSRSWTQKKAPDLYNVIRGERITKSWIESFMSHHCLTQFTRTIAPRQTMQKKRISNIVPYMWICLVVNQKLDKDQSNKALRWRAPFQQHGKEQYIQNYLCRLCLLHHWLKVQLIQDLARRTSGKENRQFFGDLNPCLLSSKFEKILELLSHSRTKTANNNRFLGRSALSEEFLQKPFF